MIKKIWYTALGSAALTFPPLVFAETIVPDTLPNVGMLAVIQAVIKFILIVAFIAAFIMLLIGGIRWILAGGDEKAVSSARGTITAALIGLVIVLLSFAIIKLVEAFFGVTIISGDITIPTIQDSATL